MIERTDRVNWSSLRWILTSPRHYRHALDNPREDTEALQLGRLVHAMVYEPHAVAERYVVEPRFHGGMNDDTAREKGYDGGKQAKAAWALANAGREIVPAELHARATGMRESILSDPTARAFVDGGKAEQLVEWTDAQTGIECRGRVDHINGRLSDLKSTARIQAFPRQCASLMYHAQLAYYADGLAANGYEPEHPPALIVVESVAPFDVAVYMAGPDALEAGRALYRRALDTLAECRALDRWPGIGGGMVQTLTLPAWAMDPEPDEEITVGGERLF